MVVTTGYLLGTDGQVNDVQSDGEHMRSINETQNGSQSYDVGSANDDPYSLPEDALNMAASESRHATLRVPRMLSNGVDRKIRKPNAIGHQRYNLAEAAENFSNTDGCVPHDYVC